MKKLMLIIMIFALLTCSACAKPTTTEKDTQETASVADNGAQTPERTNQQTPEQTPLKNSSQILAQTPNGQPSDEEIMALYKKDVEAYGWFDLCSMPFTYNEEDRRVVDGQQYDKVSYPGISTYAQLRAYLNTLSAPELTQRLLGANGGTVRYRDINGELYGIDAARGSDISQGEERYTIIRDIL